MSVDIFFLAVLKANVGLKVTVWCNGKLNSSVLKTGAALASMLRFHHARLLCLMLVSKSFLCGCVSLFLFLQTLVFISKDFWDNYPQVFHVSWVLNVVLGSSLHDYECKRVLGVEVSFWEVLSTDDLQYSMFIEQCISLTNSGLAFVVAESTGSSGMLQELS